jgi:hypothetical protein
MSRREFVRVFVMAAMAVAARKTVRVNDVGNVCYAVKDGNWSDPSTWKNGIMPHRESIVFANGHSVEIDRSVNVKELRNDDALGAIDGGQFLTTRYAVSADRILFGKSGQATVHMSNPFSLLTFGQAMASPA